MSEGGHMSSVWPKLDALFVALREEHRQLNPGELETAVLERIREDQNDDYDAVTELELDFDFNGVPWTENLIEDAHKSSEQAGDWNEFRTSVLNRVNTKGDDDGWVLEGEPSIRLGSILAEHNHQAIAKFEGQWSEMKKYVLGRIQAPGADSLAIEQLTSEHLFELKRSEAIFAGPFRAEVERRLRRAKAQQASWWTTWKPRFQWSGGMAALAAVFVIAVLPVTPPDGPDGSDLTGHVSVDSVNFEGDVMMIPDEGVTVAVVTGV